MMKFNPIEYPKSLRHKWYVRPILNELNEMICKVIGITLDNIPLSSFDDNFKV